MADSLVVVIVSTESFQVAKKVFESYMGIRKVMLEVV